MMKKADSFLETIYTRRSVRFFKNKKVPKEKIDKIIEAGLRAPSSKNSQPWFIFVLEEKKNKIYNWTLDRINEIGITSVKVPKLKNNQRTTSPLDSSKASLKIILQAPILILLFNRGPFTGGLKKRGRNQKRDNMYTSEIIGIGACMQNILLAAHSLGLGAVPLMDIWPAASLIEKKFKIPYDFIIGIAIGYPKISSKKRDIQIEKFSKIIK